MTYGNLGQKKPGHLSAPSRNSKTAGKDTTPKQALRGYGGAVSSNSKKVGTKPIEGQTVRGYPKSKSSRKGR